MYTTFENSSYNKITPILDSSTTQHLKPTERSSTTPNLGSKLFNPLYETTEAQHDQEEQTRENEVAAPVAKVMLFPPADAVNVAGLFLIH